MPLSHVDENGKASMVDISKKAAVKRTAKAYGRVIMKAETIDLINKNRIKKGDVLAVARIAGIMGGKETPKLIPLCHTISIDHIEIRFGLTEEAVEIWSTARCTDKTGIEMEVLTAVSIAALTIYDMCKAADKSMRITDIHLIEKTKQ